MSTAGYVIGAIAFWICIYLLIGAAVDRWRGRG